MKTKFTTILILLFMSNMGFSQTIEIEKKTANDKIEASLKQKRKSAALGDAWTVFIEKGYPILPFDEKTNKVQYEFVTGLPPY